MEETIKLSEVFSEYTFTAAALASAVCAHLTVDRDLRTVSAEVEPKEYVPIAVLENEELEIARSYGLGKVVLKATFPAAALEQVPERDLCEVMIDSYSPFAGTLAGSRWELSDGKYLIHLRANGKAELEQRLIYLKNWIREHFSGRTVEFAIEAGHELSGNALNEEMERIRREAATAVPAVSFKDAAPAAAKPAASDAVLGKPFKGDPVPMKDLSLDMYKVIVEGEVFAVAHRELKKRNAWIVCFDVTDYTGSVRVSTFMEADKAQPVLDAITGPGLWIKMQGKMSYSKYENDMVLEPSAIMVGKKPQRNDTAEGEKRVELHLHTTMSAMDALTKTADAVNTAARWGHKAIAITDHGGCQSFPDALHAQEKLAKKGKQIKILYGCEGYFINDVDDRIAVHGDSLLPTDTEIVAFDLETTGLNSRYDTIIEIGAAVFKGDEIIDRFQTFVNPHRRLEQKIVDLTGIRDEMLADAPSIEQVLPEFLSFCGDRPLCAHNADFDVGFITAACRNLGIENFKPVYLDTLIMAQNMLPELGKYKLNIVADHLGLPDFNHHRAVDDAVTCGQMLQRFLKNMREEGIETIDAIGPYMQKLRSGAKRLDGRNTRHIILFAKNNTGLRNLYRLVSYGNLKYFKRVPRIPKSDLMQWREGLIIGSACEAGELFQAIVNHKSYEECRRIASFYDFLEIQPLCNNRFMIEEGTAANEEELREFNRTVVRLGEDLGKPVCATGDVHFLNPEDEIYRHILLATKKFKDADKNLPIYFKTTDEMLKEFSYLGEEKAYEVVVANPNMIADMCENIRPVPHNLFPPAIENSVQKLQDMVYEKMHRLYGPNPPEIVTKRVDTELNTIIGHHYDVIYLSAVMLVKNSNEHGYLVGSRGSVGSSLVAFMSGITEVNSLPPHYRCPKCFYCSFDVPDDINCGADLPNAVCPNCGQPLVKDGFNIPFETFLGFPGSEKVPDIDLNFSGEYQAKAHAYCVEMFGSSHVFRAGTMGTVAEKTAYGYVKKYLEERGKTVSKAEENRLAIGCVDVKRTTGQHPGGLVVIPAENEIYDFCPVQHPADDTETDTITTHFEYHSMEENLLKLDMLGHDDPTMIRMMEDMTGIDATQIPLDDPDTRSIFLNSRALGFEDDPILGSDGTCGVPEFGTGFTRGMLRETQPSQFDVLIRLSGFSHGTDVWLGNARDIILSGKASVAEAIGCRDDIMLSLIKKGMPDKRSFKIMEAVRKGRGLPEGAEQEMIDHNVPDWFIESCKKIKYLFPKAHAAAYVMMAFRIAWFKVHEPLAFYSAYFYRRSQKDGFDAAMMTHGIDTVRENLLRIKNSEDTTGKEDDLFTTLEMCYEFYIRGFEFLPMNIYESHATKFLIRDGKLLPPFVSISGLGESAAMDIMEGRKNRTFISIEEFSAACPKVSGTHIDYLRAAGAFGDMPETSQVTLF